ncbi:Cysteine proteinase [Mycena sanguinolenta]|uniref:ubiquitinyl hydrolase 1 n=1 Tax=Mycena sanguinolenta TaxID=230812 RepID=A0A8H7D9T6_9AGAR|nr:Cysteine proteinase [Mycena sanguinolenta]
MSVHVPTKIYVSSLISDKDSTTFGKFLDLISAVPDEDISLRLLIIQATATQGSLNSYEVLARFFFVLGVVFLGLLGYRVCPGFRLTCLVIRETYTSLAHEDQNLITMASHYQAHLGPTYYIDPQSPSQNYGPEYGNGNIYAPGPSTGQNPMSGGGYPAPSHQYNAGSHGHGHHPGMASPRLNGRGTSAGYSNANTNPQLSRGGHTRGIQQQHPHPGPSYTHAAHAHAHAHTNYRPPYTQPPYPHPHPQMHPQYPHPHPHAHPTSYPVMYAPAAPMPSWGGQQQPHQQQQLSPLPKQDMPLASPQQLLTPIVSSSYSPTMAAGFGFRLYIYTQTTPFGVAAVTIRVQRVYPRLPLLSIILHPTLRPPPPAPPLSFSSTSLPSPEPTSPTPLAPVHEPASPITINTSGGWAIWSRRPHNPAHAPGVIISPRARPPPGVVAGAREERTPPVSPVLESTSGEASKARGDDEETPMTVDQAEQVTTSIEGVATSAESSPSPDDADALALDAEREPPSSGASTADNTDTRPSTSGTRTPTTMATTIPGSPASGSGALPKSPAAAIEPEVAVSSSASTSTSSPDIATTAAAPTTESPATTTTTTEPAPAPAPAVPAPKKSWASLLRAPATPSAPSSSAAGGAATAATSGQKPKWNGLPTSSVVGFSIPAGAHVEKSVEEGKGPSPATRAALLALLNAPADGTSSVPAGRTFAESASAAAAAPLSSSAAVSEGKLTPRGLINTGNMCFANAVLQVLVYCAPFATLFAKMRAVLGEAEFELEAPGAGSGFGPTPGGQDSGSGDVGAGSATAGAGGVLGAAPLVRATGAFLREFVVALKKPKVGKGKASPAEEQEEDPEAFIPTYVYDALKGKKRFDGMRGGHQEDAEEFLGFFLDTLEEELLAVVAALSPPAASTSKRVNNATSSSASANGGRAVVEEREEEAPSEADDGWLEVGKKNRTVVTRTIKTAESPITRIFGGRFRSTLRAPGQKDSVIVEDWRSLRLDIQRDGIHTIADALALISHPQTVQVSQPSRPGIVVDASQQILIDALPPILILHVKRFCYDTAVGGVVKVGKRVAFGPELEVGNDVMVPAARKQAVRYKLFGVVYHHGVSASGGHYTLDILHPTRFPATSTGAAGEREGWVRIDDELVSDVRPVDVFEGYDSEGGDLMLGAFFCVPSVQ